MMGDRIMPDSEPYEGWSPCEDRSPAELEGDAQAAGALYLTDLNVALRNGGIEVWESPGWRQRGHGGLAGPPRGVLIHHTAGGGPNDWKIVQNGRSDLPGPLAQMTLERNGSVRLLAAGQCWHSGNGTHPGVGGAVGNGRLIGIEGVSRGVGNDWTPEQRRIYPKVAAALCRHYKLPPSAVVGHKEYATPRGRKIDPDAWVMDDFRAETARNMSAPAEEFDAVANQQLENINTQVSTGWPQWLYHESNLPEGKRTRWTLVDMVRYLVQKHLSLIPTRTVPTDVPEDARGNLLNIEARLIQQQAQLDRIEAILPKAR